MTVSRTAWQHVLSIMIDGTWRQSVAASSPREQKWEVRKVPRAAVSTASGLLWAPTRLATLASLVSLAVLKASKTVVARL